MSEIIDKLQVTPDKFQKYLAAVSSAKSLISVNDSILYLNDEDEIVNLVEEIPEPDEDNFLNVAIENEQTEFLISYLENLEEKNRLIMILYYYEDRTFKEIGADLGISESRVCQIHTKIIKELREKFKGFLNAK